MDNSIFISVVGLIATCLATIFTGYQVYKFNHDNNLSMKRTKKLYVQKIKLNHEYIKNNLDRFELSFNKISQGYNLTEYAKDLNILSYYISSICNKKFEEVISDQIKFTEEYFKVNTSNRNIEENKILQAHKDLIEVCALIKNSNYLISIFFPLSFDEALAQDIHNIYIYKEKNISFRLSDNKNILYCPPSGQDKLGYATPLMFYGKYISKLTEEYGIDRSEFPLDLPYITINDFSEKGDYKSLMESIEISKTTLLLRKITNIFDSLIED
ncbi:hypothetical protein [Macrococcoides caseolyticum]|uniref:hypothetical protein n=1 Tax=Macrococcoides caseolyticum TaxID=69966 RepID=UPI000C323EF9|nr:hypothetical protein [Macrococcus caseolyticus]PKE48587.1 hypothetical protein CW677_02915 [Macrococcus caseolyticus]PKF15638.1 hypothetical protein CW690_02915 [Macrococcus caseolyticus]TDM25998.1 hypothetical protein ETI01_02660 [Macrococcus caseolyticus]